MTESAPTTTRGRGELGMALDELAEQHGTLTAFANLLGCGTESLGRWIRGDSRPSPKYARKICEYYPGMQTILELYGCFRDPARRAPVVSGKLPAATSERSQKRIAAARKAAAKRSKKAARLNLIKRRHKLMQRKSAAPEGRLDRRLLPRSPDRREDWLEQVAEQVATDVAFTPSYMMEGL